MPLLQRSSTLSSTQCHNSSWSIALIFKYELVVWPCVSTRLSFSKQEDQIVLYQQWNDVTKNAKQKYVVGEGRVQPEDITILQRQN